ncbi:MAG: serine/threonine-protein kinase [Hyphomicrobiales bacterium]
MSGNNQHPEAGYSTVQPGTELNQTYCIDSLIGIGGMGEVFRGHNIQTGDAVAIKIVLPEFARDELILDLFRKEARILHHLAHDAIVRYYVFSIDAAVGRPYLAMEFVDGPSLAERIKSGPLSLEECTVLRRRVADGLHKAHEAGIIHRDISPDNVILPDGRVDRAKIIDFGIAKSAHVGGGTLLGGSFAGKYNFVSPEQLGLFGAEVTAKSDIYSLGLVLTAAIQGYPIDMTGSQVEVIEKRRAVPDLSGLPKEIQGLLRSMLEPDPAARLSSMAAVRDWSPGGKVARVESEPTIVRPRKPATVQPGRPAGLPQQKVQRPSGAKPNTWGRGLAIAGIAISAIAVGSFGGWYYVNSLNGKAKQETTVGTETPVPKPAPPPAEEIPKPAPPAAEDIPKPAPPPTDEPSPQPPVETKKNLEPVEVPPVPAPSEPEEIPGKVTKLETPPPVPAAITAESRTRLVENYDGGDCFLALTREVAQAGTLIVAYGNRKQAFEQFAASYHTALGEEPNARFGQLTDAQCRVLNLLRQVERTSRGKPWLKLLKVNLRESKIANASDLRGNLEGLRQSSLYLLVIDDEGVIYNLTKKIEPTANGLGFSERFTVTDRGRGRSQLILAISASLPLRVLEKSGPKLSPGDFDLLLAELSAAETDAAADMKTFSVE